MEPLSIHLANLAENAGLKTCLAGAWTLLGWCLGGVDKALVALCVLMCADYALGFIRAWRCNNIRASKMRAGVFKFALYGAVVILATMLDIVVNHAAAKLFNLPVRGLLVAYLGATEFLSAAQHLAALGVRLPAKFLDRIRAYRDGEDKGGCRG